MTGKDKLKIPLGGGCRRPFGEGEGFCNANTQRSCVRSLNCSCGLRTGKTKDEDDTWWCADATACLHTTHGNCSAHCIPQKNPASPLLLAP